MEHNFVSTALYSGEPIDSRCLSLAMEFYRLSRKQTVELAEEVVFWLLELCPKDQFVFAQRGYNNRIVSTKNALSELHNSATIPLHWLYSFEAYVSSDIVHDKKTMSAYTKDLQHGITAHRAKLLNPFAVSVDYPQYWANLFSSGREKDAQIKEKLLKLFYEEGRLPRKFFLAPDVSALISISPYEKDQERHYGSITIDFSAFCLGASLRRTAKKFSDFAEYLSNRYGSLNARVMLQPKHCASGSPHSLYFGSSGSVDDSHLEENCTEKEWYATYYLPGVEWTNIIAPLAQTHITFLQKSACVPDDIAVTSLPGGGLLVKADVPIDGYDVSHACKLKQLLYPALYPGRRNYPLKMLFPTPAQNTPTIPCLRKDWEIVPIFGDEIDIVSTYLAFAHSESRANKLQDEE